MKIQTLVSTMNRDDIDFLIPMNIETDVVIGNQNGTTEIKEYQRQNQSVKMICSATKGLSKNRNITINNANADICILADDDIEYIEGYSQIIKQAFENLPDADIIIFNVREDPIVRYVIQKIQRVKGLSFLHYGSVRIAFKRESIVGKVSFDEEFGSGGRIPLGEDTIFLSDCLKAGLRIYAVPQYILMIPESPSTWFEGYNDTYFLNKGKMYKRIFGTLGIAISIMDATRHMKEYKNNGTPLHNITIMINGIKGYQKSEVH